VDTHVRFEASRGDLCDLVSLQSFRLGLLGGPRQTSGDLPGDSESTTWHITARSGNGLVGVATLVIDPAPFDPQVLWRLRALAVAPEFRGRGLGRVLIQERLLLCGVEAAWADVRLGTSLALHTSLGGIPVGEPKVNPSSWHTGNRGNPASAR